MPQLLAEDARNGHQKRHQRRRRDERETAFEC